MAAVACDGAPAGPVDTARFSQATAEQLETVLSTPTLPTSAGVAVALHALVESGSSNGQCPQIQDDHNVQLMITGNGCTLPNGGRYDGTARIVALEPGSELVSMTFEDFRRSGPGDVSFRLDGSVELTETEAGALRQDVDLELEARISKVMDEPKEMDIAMSTSALCQKRDQKTLECVYQPGSWVDIAGLGRYQIEGGYIRDLSAAVDGISGISGSLAFHGAERLHLEYAAGEECVQYTIGDAAPQMLCIPPEGIFDLVPGGASGS